MDKIKAKKLENQLIGNNINGFKINKLLDNGKSATVFLVSDNKNNNYALKIFDNDLIENFGHQVQIQRIQQEIDLKDHTYNNLVKIIDGGVTQVENEDYYYILMEFVDGINLKNFIETKEYNQDFIIQTLKTLFYLSEDLLRSSIVHRDIKPENIMINTENKLILMDLGVLKLVGAQSFTDIDEKRFLGTLRYGPPEWLRREEDDNENGWRAINIYQIGGVLHDLIMGHELFQKEVPYPNLAYAIREKLPNLNNDNYDFRLIQFSMNMLSKDPKRRIELCTETKLEKLIIDINKPIDKINSDINDIKGIVQKHSFGFKEIDKLKRTEEEKQKSRNDITKSIFEIVNDEILFIKEENICSDVINIGDFFFQNDRKYLKQQNILNVMYRIKGNYKQGILKEFLIIFRIINDENKDCSVMMLGIIPSRLLKIDKKSPNNIISDIVNEKNDISPTRKYVIMGRSHKPVNFDFQFYEIFQGIIVNNKILSDIIKSAIIKLFKHIIKLWEPEIEKEIDRVKQSYISKKQSSSTFITSSIKTDLIYKL